MKKIIKIILFFTLSLIIFPNNVSAQDKIKIGLLVPISGEFSEIGKSIIKSTLICYSFTATSCFRLTILAK